MLLALLCCAKDFVSHMRLKVSQRVCVCVCANINARCYDFRFIRDKTITKYVRKLSTHQNEKKQNETKHTNETTEIARKCALVHSIYYVDSICAI